jgi:hypothetical protein
MPCSFTATRVILVDQANTNSLVWYVLAVLTWFSASANLSVACSRSKFNPPLAGKLWSAWATTTTHSSLSLLARSRVYSRSVCSAMLFNSSVKSKCIKNFKGAFAKTWSCPPQLLVTPITQSSHCWLQGALLVIHISLSRLLTL